MSTNTCSVKSPLIFHTVDNNKNTCSPNDINANCASISSQNVAQDFIHFVVNNAIKSDVISLVNDVTVVLDDCCKKTYNTAIICDNVL